jgi:Carboxypeptidase regulatory-like domain
MKINALIVSIALVLTVHALRAQDTRSRWHTVQGLVVDELGKPAAMATVYLRDVGGHRLRMKQTDRRGRFSFGFVNTDHKYEIYAEQTSLTTQKLSIVAVESRKDIIFTLMLRNTGPAAARLGPDESSHGNR